MRHAGPAHGTVTIVAQLLLVEDDAEIRRALIRALANLGHVVASAPTGVEALKYVIDARPELLVLDLGLPDIDGRDLVRMLRSISQVPIVVATARDDEAMIISTLDQGADDYIIKPFSVAQLDARIRAVLRRADHEVRPQQPLVVGDLMLDPASHIVTLAGVVLELSRREFELLSYLAARAGSVVTKRELLAHVWQQPYGGADKTVDVHLSWLRRKMGETARQPRYLHTVRGVGLKLAPPETTPRPTLGEG